MTEEGPPKLITRLGLPRRQPVERDRYRAAARTAGIPRRARLLAFDGALAVILVLAALLALPRVAAGVGTGFDQLLASVQTAIPLLQGQSTIQLPAGGAAAPVGAAPIVEGLPLFTRDPQLQFSGRVPGFAIQPGRSVQIVLNGALIATNPIEQAGTFSGAVALKDGTNTISLVLIDNRDVVATSSYSITLDRKPPDLKIAVPQPDATVDTANVVVRGTTEVGATLTINGRSVIVLPDGSFTDSSNASAGPLVITVVARDRAGNETTTKINVVAQPQTQPGGPTLTVTLTSTTVRPGQGVFATVTLRDANGPRAGVQVTLSLGAVPIASATTDTTGTARIGFAAPTTLGDIGVVVLGGGASGKATLTVAR
jgi:Glucodextranase, domain B